MALVIYTGNQSSAMDMMESGPVNSYVGLSNQGATCYLNSLLQTLFMTPEFRKAIFMWHYDRNSHGPEQYCIPLQLQRLFGQLAVGKMRSVDTVALTKSFGWEGSEVFQQQDVQELTRVLFDALEQTFKGTEVENVIDQLYAGELVDYLRCIDVEYESERRDKFLDLSLSIIPFGSNKAMRSLNECIELFLKPELLDGDNQYFAESVGRKVDAIKGLKFGRLPLIMSCNLKRFVYDFSGANITQKKLNEVVRFPMILDMNRYVARGRGRASSVSSSNVADNSDGAAIVSDDVGIAVGQDDDFEEFLREQINKLRANGSAGSGSASSAVEAIDENDPTVPDLVDVLGNKHPDQAKEELKERAEEKSWSLDEIITLVQTRGEWVYELFAVLIHSGAISGGHYYAYIKNLEYEGRPASSTSTSEWWNFNDSSVTKITEAAVREAFGSVHTYTTTTYGQAKTVSTQSCANAYMLMYRKVSLNQLLSKKERLSGVASTEEAAGSLPSGVVASSRFPSLQVPEYIHKEIQQREDEMLAKQRAIEEAKNNIVIKITWKGTDYSVTCSKKQAFKELLVKIREQLALTSAPEFSDRPETDQSQPLSEWPPLDRFRLRFFNVTTKLPAESFALEMEGEKTLEVLGLSAYRPMLLETRLADEVWEEYYIDGVNIQLEEYDRDLDVFLPVCGIRMKKMTTVAELYDKVASWVSYPRDELFIVKARPSTYLDVTVDILLPTSAKTLKDDLGLTEYVKVFFERMPQLGAAAEAAEAADVAMTSKSDPDGESAHSAPFNRRTYVTTFTTLNGQIVAVPQNEPAHYSGSIKRFISQRCRVNIIFNKPPSTAFTSKLLADARWPVGRLREEIAKILEVEDLSAFRMLKSSFNGIELKENTVKLVTSGLYDNSYIAIVMGQKLPAGTFSVSLFQFNPDFEPHVYLLPALPQDLSSATVVNTMSVTKAASTLTEADVGFLLKEGQLAISKATSAAVAEAVEAAMSKAMNGYVESWPTGSDSDSDAEQARPIFVNPKTLSKTYGPAASESLSCSVTIPSDDTTSPVDAVCVAEPISTSSNTPDILQVVEAIPIPPIAVELQEMSTADVVSCKTDETQSPDQTGGSDGLKQVPVEPNDFAERSTIPMTTNLNFIQIPKIEMAPLNLGFEIVDLEAARNDRQDFIRDKVGTRADRILRCGITAEDIAEYLAEEKVRAEGERQYGSDVERSSGVVLDYYLNAGLRLKGRTFKDHGLHLFDNKGLCFQILPEPEFLDHERKGDVIVLLQEFDRANYCLTKPREVLLPGNMTICDIGRALAIMLRIPEASLWALIVISGQTALLRHLSSDHPRMTSKPWFCPLNEKTMLQDMWGLRTGDVLVVQNRSVELRALTEAERLSVELVEAAERGPYLTTGWQYSYAGAGVSTDVNSVSRPAAAGIKIKVHKGDGSSSELSTTSPSPEPAPTTTSGSKAPFSLFGDLLD